ncbi:hypothetical protein Tco_0578307 [Tanacetum coccineum]
MQPQLCRHFETTVSKYRVSSRKPYQDAFEGLVLDFIAEEEDKIKQLEEHIRRTKEVFMKHDDSFMGALKDKMEKTYQPVDDDLEEGWWLEWDLLGIKGLLQVYAAGRTYLDLSRLATTLNRLERGSDDENPPPPPPQTPIQQAPHTVPTIKLPILKKGGYDIWAMKIEHYLSHTDYPIWEVIQKGNGPVSVSTDTNGVIKGLPPKTAEEILARERERKARTTLLMALLEDHLAKFHKMTDAKEM